MAKIPYTLVRGRTYYFRMRVPEDLKKEYKGQGYIVKSLKTSDPADARERMTVAKLHVESEFREKRKVQKALSHKRRLDNLSEGEIISMVVLWYQEAFKEAEADYWERTEKNTFIQQDVIENLQFTQSEISDLYENMSYLKAPARKILDSKNLEYDEKSVSFRKFSELVTRGDLDLCTRLLQKYEGKPVVGIRDPDFDKYSKSVSKELITFGQVCDQYDQSRIDKGVKPLSMKKVRAELAFLKKLIGDDLPLDQIERSKCREIFETLKRLPANASKKYPNKSIEQAIEKGQKEGARCISVRTINNYINALSSLFRFALEEGMTDKNPASGLRIVDPIAKEDKRSSFSVDDLKKIFYSPLYTGCIDDKRNYNKVGTNKPRNTRFWVPIIALWTGMRLGEICNLHASDIIEKEGFSYIRVHRVLKTKNSLRSVPVHSMLEKIGFLEMVSGVTKRQDDRLFPDIDLDDAGNTVTREFSKWFRRYLKNTGVVDKKKVFHSFRHTFNDALTDAEVPAQFARSIAGWSGGGMEEIYGDGPTPEKLYNYIQKIEYRGLDLSHLYLNKN